MIDLFSGIYTFDWVVTFVFALELLNGQSTAVLYENSRTGTLVMYIYTFY